MPMPTKLGIPTKNKPDVHINYLLEPILNSELILINNAKLLSKDKNILAEEHLDRIHELREQFIVLENRTDRGEKGLQKEKRIIRDELRDLSYITFTNRDNHLFGQMIYTMVQKIATRPQFSGYTFIDEMKSLAIQHILLYTWKFNPYRQSEITGQYASAFAYCSTIIFNAFIATINKFNKEQDKAKEEFLERQKLIHKDPNISTYGPDYSEATRTIKLTTLKEGELLHKIKSITITDETKFIIPSDYKITTKDYDFITKYKYNISVVRDK